MIVTLKNEDDVIIGHVEPPKVNGNCIYYDALAGKRAKNGQLLNVHDALNDLWDIWQNEMPNAAHDDEFAAWLVKKHHWNWSGMDIIEHNFGETK